jgi:hypothetical protein
VSSIVDPTRVVKGSTAHNFAYDSHLAVDENHRPIVGPRSKSVSFRKLRINHYAMKSEEEARAKIARGYWDDFAVWRRNMLRGRIEQVCDETIMRYVEPLRAALAARDRQNGRAAPS